MRLRTVVRQVHLWMGLALSLILLAVAATGSALVYKEAWWRLVHPELRGPVPALTLEDHAAALARAEAAFGPELRTFKFPEPGVDAYHLYLEGGEAFLSTSDLSVIDRWGTYERFMSVLFDLHAHLMLGETGERLGGVVALFGVLMLVTGVVLWWPARRRFRAAHLLPHGWKRRKMIAWHRDLGLVATPILSVLLATGAGIVFYGAAGVVLSGLFGDRPLAPEPPAPAVEVPASSMPDAPTLAAVQRAFPDGRLVFYYPVGEAEPLHRFRLKQPCELHPNGRSYVYADGAGRVVRAEDACALPPGERARHAIYPLHAAKIGSGVYKLLSFLGGLALAALAASGVVAYGGKLRQRRSAGPAGPLTRPVPVSHGGGARAAPPRSRSRARS